MKKIFEQNEILPYIETCKYQGILKEFASKIYLIQYQNGEFLSAPFQKENLFQIIVQGKADIYFVRDDGTKYSLSSADTEYLLGEMEFFREKNDSVYAEAIHEVVCLAISIDQHREELLNHNQFLRLLADSLAGKMQLLTEIDAALPSLEERILSYMKYKCRSGVLKGIEQAAFHLHCSARQLQRLLNQYEKDGVVRKIGKGTYQLTDQRQW